MIKEDLRLVEVTISTKTKAKKGKKAVTKTKKKTGLFHAWGTTTDSKGKEKFFALVEDAKSGKLSEVSYKNVRFITEADLLAMAEPEVKAEEPKAEAPAEEVKPKAPRKKPAAKVDAPAKTAQLRPSRAKVKPAQATDEAAPSAEATAE